MSVLIDNLHPFATTHSISEAVVTFHLVKKIDSPQDFVEKFKPMFPDFNEIGITFSQGIQVHLEQIEKKYLPKINSSDPQIEGFFAKKTNDKKKQNLVIQSQNSFPQNIPVLSIHILEYTRWGPFLENVLSIVKKLSEMELFIVRAIGLTFVDMFNWHSKENLPINKIFIENNQYLPANFFSYIGNFQIINSGTIRKEKEKEYVEKIDILSKKIGDEKIHLQIIHEVILDLKKQILLIELLNINGNLQLNRILNYEHSLNKKFLNNILSADLKSLINLTL